MDKDVLPLPADEAHIWCVRTDALAQDDARLAAYENLLTDEERARRDRFMFEKGRHECLITRALVRTTLSRYAKVDPRNWRFGQNEHGKPFVISPPGHAWMSFNLSHTAGLIVCMMARTHDVGVDVEDTERGGQTVEIANRFFADAEVRALHGLPEAQRHRRFFVYWTLKEAYIKARGKGLAIPLAHFAYVLENDDIRITFDPKLPDEPSAWQFGLFAVTARHAGAWAIRRGVGTRDLRVVVREVVP